MKYLSWHRRWTFWIFKMDSKEWQSYIFCLFFSESAIFISQSWSRSRVSAWAHQGYSKIYISWSEFEGTFCRAVNEITKTGLPVHDKGVQTHSVHYLNVVHLLHGLWLPARIQLFPQLFNNAQNSPALLPISIKVLSNIICHAPPPALGVHMLPLPPQPIEACVYNFNQMKWNYVSGRDNN